MSDEASEDLTWLLQPPEPGHLQIYIRAGEGTELTDEQRDALETLMGTLYDSEVAGFALNETCRPLSCQVLVNCMMKACTGYACEVASFRIL